MGWLGGGGTGCQPGGRAVPSRVGVPWVPPGALFLHGWEPTPR